MRIQPNESIYVKIVTKKPGIELDTLITDLDLNYKERYK